MNRGLHFVAHKLICLFVRYVILVSQGGSQGASQGGGSSARLFDLTCPGVTPPLNRGSQHESRDIGPSYSNVIVINIEIYSTERGICLSALSSARLFLGTLMGVPERRVVLKKK